MNWIYLSPHLDDVALSVGGLLYEQSHAGEQVSIWTICAGDPPPGDFSSFAKALHTRWETGVESMHIRRREDKESCKLLGSIYVHFCIPDCIYRRSTRSGEHLYASEEALWIPVHPDEEELVGQIALKISKKLPKDANVISPLSLGNHVDHRLTRKAAERLGIPLLFYADYPYVLKEQHIKKLESRQSIRRTISPESLSVWQDAISAHKSQISTFWANLDEMRSAIQAYYHLMGGIRLFN